MDSSSGLNSPPRLTGLLRFQITKEWMKRGKPGILEDFIKKVCETKDIEYVPRGHKKGLK